jgi:hypothetical protein
MTSYTLIVTFLLVGYGFMTYNLYGGRKKIATMPSYTQYLFVSSMLMLFWPILLTIPLLKPKKS